MGAPYVLANAYHNDVNADLREMTMWARCLHGTLLGAMGFYPVCPGDGIYIIGGPLFTVESYTPFGREVVQASRNLRLRLRIRSPTIRTSKKCEAQWEAAVARLDSTQ